MTTLLIRTDLNGPAALVDPVQPGARIFPGLERLQALVDGDRPYALKTEIELDGSRILYGGHDHLEPLGRISAAECARFVGMGQPVLQIDALLPSDPQPRGDGPGGDGPGGDGPGGES